MMRLVSFTSRHNDLHVRVNPDMVLYFYQIDNQDVDIGKQVDAVRIIFPASRELEVLGNIGEIEETLSIDFDD